MIDMIGVLEEVEKELPDLLDRYDWESLNVDYFPPKVWRVWRQHGDFRICLHKIFPTDKVVLYHPHKWPSAMRVLKGQYEMNLGYKWDIELDPHHAGKLILAAGSAYEMNLPHQWHSVRPVNCEYALTLMIMGPMYKSKFEGREVKKKLQPLGDRTKRAIKTEFKEYYKHEV